MSTGEECLDESALDGTWIAEFTQALDGNRAQARQLIAEQCERVRRVEVALDEQRQQLEQHFAARRRNLVGREASVERQKQELNKRNEKLQQLKQQLAERQSRWNQLQEESAKQQQVLLGQLQDQLHEIDKKRSQLEAQQLEQISHQPELDGKSNDGNSAEMTGELASLRAEKRALQERLANTETQLQSALTKEESAPHLSEVQDRLETALQELHQLQSRNIELENQLASVSQESRGANPASQVEGLDWETQKQRMLEQLENDSDESDQQQQADRLKVQEAIQVTEHAVAEKDREIRELKNLLDEQANNVGQMAVGATAVAEILNSDELITHERESLRLLQEQWREKLRKAEIEISTERARLARERNALEDRILALEKTQAKNAGGDLVGNSDKPVRGHWLARLGLMDADDH